MVREGGAGTGDAVMDDPGRASSGVSHTVTKGAVSSVGLNNEALETYHQKIGQDR